MVPDAVVDEFMVDLTGADLKALLYIIRRTFGFKKDRDDISLSTGTRPAKAVCSTVAVRRPSSKPSAVSRTAALPKHDVVRVAKEK